MSPTECKCVRCFPCFAVGGTACWGCDGSGLTEKCEACFGPECTSADCDTRTKEPKRDTNRLPFCDECFEELKKEMPDAD